MTLMFAGSWMGDLCWTLDAKHQNHTLDFIPHSTYQK